MDEELKTKIKAVNTAVGGVKHYFNNSVSPIGMLIDMKQLEKADAEESKRFFVGGMETLLGEIADSELQTKLNELKRQAEEGDWTDPLVIQSLKDAYGAFMKEYDLPGGYR